MIPRRAKRSRGIHFDLRSFERAAELYETGHDAGPNGDVKKKTFVISGVGTSTITVQIVGYDDDRVVQRISGTAQLVEEGGANPSRMKLMASCPEANSLNIDGVARRRQPGRGCRGRRPGSGASESRWPAFFNSQAGSGRATLGAP